MRKTSVDIPAFLGVRFCFNNNPRDRNMIALSVFLSPFRPVFFSFSSVCLHFWFSLLCKVTLKPAKFPPDIESCITQHGSPTHWHHQQSGITIAQLFIWLASSSAVTSTHLRHLWVNILVTSQRRPVSSPAPAPSSSHGSSEAVRWTCVRLIRGARVSRGKQEVTGDF